MKYKSKFSLRFYGINCIELFKNCMQEKTLKF